ncbi:MAG: tRNA 2-thiouridine(34) synthase MnmA [Micrococcales bacterium]|nr:tRNA 2-thiouridine(34) synthase MnmA [Micrococcales bacterium]
MRVLAALSGGVDSAVAAAAMVHAGHQVTGAYLALNRTASKSRANGENSGQVDEANEARAVADILGIDFQVWDASKQFEEQVVEGFVAEYAAGRTPNPCVRCNRLIKLRLLQTKATALGFDAICTGHYARLCLKDDQVQLRRSKDRAKDQSYVLAAVEAKVLSRCLFPLGDMTSKAEVRAQARSLGLPAAAKPDSVDICFIADGDVQGFLRQRLGAQAGVVLDQTGTVVGHHDGAYGFTVGQRRGLALGDPDPTGRPRYVTAVDVPGGLVRVGLAEDLAVESFGLSQLSWLVPQPGPVFETEVQVRAHGRVYPCHLTWQEQDRGNVALDQPIGALAAGQSAVFYRGDLVIAHGLVERD